MADRGSSDVPPGRRVLVPVANPASVRPLLRCAAALARPDGGEVHLLSVLGSHLDPDMRANVQRGLEAAQAQAPQLGVRVHIHAFDGDDVAAAVLASARDLAASLVLIGWRGSSSTSDVFGRLIDSVMGRSSVPLAIVRLGTVPFGRVVLPVSPDHLLPGGRGGLSLAVGLAERLHRDTREPVAVLRTGARGTSLPPALTRVADRVHHDPRRIHQAVGAFARPDDVVVAAIAPTPSGLRSATTHLAWAAPEATLLVAVDVGPVAGLRRAVEGVERPGPAHTEGERRWRIVVTVRLPDDLAVTPDHLARVLARAGTTDHLMAWWATGDPRPQVSATVSLTADGANDAIATVMTILHDAAEFGGAEISYDVETAEDGGEIAVRTEELTLIHTPAAPQRTP